MRQNTSTEYTVTDRQTDRQTDAIKTIPGLKLAVHNAMTMTKYI